MNNSLFEAVLKGDVDPSEIDISGFQLGGTAQEALKRMIMKGRIELMQLSEQAGSMDAEAFHKAFTTKSYEVEYCQYLLDLSDANIEKENKNH